MKRIIVFLTCLFLAIAFDANAQYKYRDNPVIKNSTSLPSTCSKGQLYIDTDEGSGTLYLCNPANTWVASGSGSAATDTIYDAAGDIVQGTGSDTAAKLSIGTAAQLLKVNAAGTALEYFSLWSGSITDEQLLCGENTDGTNRVKSCGAKTTDNSTASHGMYKDSNGYVANLVTAIDAHAASTTITLIPGICPVIHNASQGAADINNALPALAEGLCFVAQVRTAQGANYWRLTAETGNTICLGTTCAKDYVQFATPAVGNFYTCTASASAWYCNQGLGTAATD